MQESILHRGYRSDRQADLKVGLYEPRSDRQADLKVGLYEATVEAGL